MAKSDDKLDHQIAMRVSEEDVARLAALSERIPIATKNAIARTALRIGLDALEENPGRIVEVAPPKRGRKAR